MKTNLKIFLIIFLTIITVLIHWHAIDKSNKGRNIIWEPDDNYHQLIKAKNLDSCYKNCLGINNLLIYDFSNFSNLQKYQHDIFLHHSAVEYHYINSKILQISNKYFNDWEKTQLFVTKIFTAILIMSFVIFITVLFNLNIGLISSIIIIPYITIKYGFHFSHGADELASIFAIFSIVLLRNQKIINYTSSLILSSLAIFSHPVGIVMMLFNYIFLIFKDKEIFDKKKIIYFFTSIVVIIFYFILDLNYLRDQYKFTNLYNSVDFGLSQIIKLIILNFKAGIYIIYDLFNLLNIIVLIVILIFLRKNIFKIIQKYIFLKPLIFASTFIFLISLIHYAPEASLITRMQQLLTLSFLSLYSVLIYEFLVQVRKYKQKFILVGSMIILFVLHSIYNLNNLNLKIKSNQQTLNLDLDTKYISNLSKKIVNSKPIIFKRNNSDLSTFKSIYYKFILEGFNAKNIFLDELFVSEERKKYLNQNFFLILPSPIINNNLIFKEKRPDCFNLSSFIKCINRGWYGVGRTRMSDLLIKNNDLLKIKINPKSNKIYLNLNTFENDVTIKDAKNNLINIGTNNSYKWVEINSTEFDFNKITFLISDEKFIKLNGIKTDFNNLNWPWGEVIKVSHDDNKVLRNFDFDIKDMIGDYFCEDYNIINDNGSFIIIDMKCQK